MTEIQRGSPDMVNKTPRCAHDDMGALLQLTAFIADIDAADTGHNTPACWRIKPLQFLRHLQGKFSRRSHNQSVWNLGIRQT